MIKNDKEKAITFLNKALELDQELVEKYREEFLFIPIKQYVTIPVKEENEQDEKEQEENYAEKEKAVEQHLETTFDLVENLNYNTIKDVKRKHNKKTINIEKEQKKRE